MQLAGCLTISQQVNSTLSQKEVGKKGKLHEQRRDEISWCQWQTERSVQDCLFRQLDVVKLARIFGRECTPDWPAVGPQDMCYMGTKSVA